MESALGLVFVFLWASVSVAAKLGYHDTKPLTLLEARFVFAALLLLVVNHLVRRRPLPHRGQWRHLAVISVTNSAGYLGLATAGLVATRIAERLAGRLDSGLTVVARARKR